MMTSNARTIAIITRGENGQDIVWLDVDEELRAALAALALPDELRPEDCDARRVLVERCTGRALRFASVSRELALRYEDLFREFICDDERWWASFDLVREALDDRSREAWRDRSRAVRRERFALSDDSGL